jgi:ATP-dependent Clp protease ATP-binding subunit ClpA
MTKPEDTMFDHYSMRALQVVFLARMKAGRRGAKAISVDDLVTALIIEDQGKLVEAASKLDDPGTPESSDTSHMVLPPHQPFLDPEAAADLLQKVEGKLDPAAPLPSHFDMPVSSDLEHALKAAADLADQFQQKEIQPLHLLAAALGEESSKGPQLLKESGITREKVLEAIREQH